MDNTIENHIIINWDKFDSDNKMEFLQYYENKNAMEFNRKQKKLVLIPFNPHSPEKMGEYNPKGKNTIAVVNCSYFRENPFEALNTVYHEGFHASVHDFFNNKKVKLNLYDADCNKKDIFYSYAIDPYLYKTKSGQYSLHENQTQKESMCSTADIFFDLVKDKAYDTPDNNRLFLKSLDQYLAYRESFKKEREIVKKSTDYPKEVDGVNNVTANEYQSYFKGTIQSKDPKKRTLNLIETMSAMSDISDNTHTLKRYLKAKIEKEKMARR